MSSLLRENHQLARIFSPRSIAVIGASQDPKKAGYQIVKNLKKIQFPGEIYPINPKATQILDLDSYPSITQIEGNLDLIVYVAPAKFMGVIMKDLSIRMEEKGDVKGLVCIAAGFSEIDTEEGIELERVLVDTCSQYGIRVIGPNCIGVIDTKSQVDTTFVETMISPDYRGSPSGISFISQSGAMAMAIMLISASQPTPVNFNKMVSVGNSADINIIDLISFLKDDISTDVIGIYLEGTEDSRRLMEVLKEVTPYKPVVVLKSGRSQSGAQAAQSHTGSLAGSYRIYQGAFKQSGVIQVESLDEMMDTLLVLNSLPVPTNNSAFILTQAGGPGIQCLDVLDEIKYVEMSHLKESAREELMEMAPDIAAICKPEGYADLTAAANTTDFINTLKFLLSQSEVGSLILILVPPMYMSPVEVARLLAYDYHALRRKYNKPIFPVIMAGKWVEEARRYLGEVAIPTFSDPIRASVALGNILFYQQYLEKIEKGVRSL